MKRSVGAAAPRSTSRKLGELRPALPHSWLRRQGPALTPDPDWPRLTTSGGATEAPATSTSAYQEDAHAFMTGTASTISTVDHQANRGWVALS